MVIYKISSLTSNDQTPRFSLHNRWSGSCNWPMDTGPMRPIHEIKESEGIEINLVKPRTIINSISSMLYIMSLILIFAHPERMIMVDQEVGTYMVQASGLNVERAMLGCGTPKIVIQCCMLNAVRAQKKTLQNRRSIFIFGMAMVDFSLVNFLVSAQVAHDRKVSTTTFNIACVRLFTSVAVHMRL